MTVTLTCFELELPETVNIVKKYQFVEHGKKRWKNGFTELRELTKHRYLIRHDMSKTWHVTNIEDSEIYIKNFLRLNGY